MWWLAPQLTQLCGVPAPSSQLPVAHQPSAQTAKAGPWAAGECVRHHTSGCASGTFDHASARRFSRMCRWDARSTLRVRPTRLQLALAAMEECSFKAKLRSHILVRTPHPPRPVRSPRRCVRANPVFSRQPRGTADDIRTPQAARTGWWPVLPTATLTGCAELRTGSRVQGCRPTAGLCMRGTCTQRWLVPTPPPGGCSGQRACPHAQLGIPETAHGPTLEYHHSLANGSSTHSLTHWLVR
jgi:hypothetical protein